VLFCLFIYLTASLVNYTISTSSSLAKLPFLSHSLSQKIAPYCIWFSLLSTSWQIFLQSKVVSLASNPQPGGLGPCIYVPLRQGGPVITSGTGFPFCRLLRLTELRWSYSHAASTLTQLNHLNKNYTSMCSVNVWANIVPHDSVSFLQQNLSENGYSCKLLHTGENPTGHCIIYIRTLSESQIT
jgi:hypothetical protein